MVYEKALRVLPWSTPPNSEPLEVPEQQGRRCFWNMPRRRPQPGHSGTGRMTNLISADTDKFTNLMPDFNLVWSAPLQLAICFCMLIKYVGWAMLGGVGVMIFLIVLSNKIRKKAASIQKAAMKIKDERLKTELEMLKIIQIIKLYAWETAIEDCVKELRNKELRAQLHYKLWAMGFFLTSSLSPTLVAVSTFTVYTALLGEELNSATAFTALSLS